MRFLVQLLGLVAIALAVGFTLSYYALTDGRLLGALRVGPWAAWPAVGAPSPDPYTRAYLARAGALQLGQGEGLAFLAADDSEGRPLDRACQYQLQGTTPVARFWTLRAVAEDGSNIAPAGGQQALQSRGVARANDGSLILNVSRRLAPMNWLEIAGDGPFRLILTLYDPANLSGSGISVTTLPAIHREGCAP